MTDDDTKGFLFAWERIVLAARISSSTKLVALALRTFANRDGTQVRPTNARLCVLCGVSYSSVTRARRKLLRAGLLQLVRRGNRRKRQADEYRLILAEDLDERLTWLSPSEIDKQAEQLTEQRQAVESARLRDRRSGVTQTPETDQGSHVPLNAGSGVTDDRDQGSHRPPTNPSDQATRTTNSGVGNATRHPRGREHEKPTSIAADGGEDQRPSCTCGVLLDPNGTCFACRTGHARSAS